MTLAISPDDKVWQVPDNYSKAGTYLRCSRCAAMVCNGPNDVRIHDEFHLSLRSALSWIAKIRIKLGVAP